MDPTSNAEKGLIEIATLNRLGPKGGLALIPLNLRQTPQFPKKFIAMLSLSIPSHSYLTPDQASSSCLFQIVKPPAILYVHSLYAEDVSTHYGRYRQWSKTF